MNIKKIDLKLPSIFYEIEEKLKKIAKGGFFAIAGGSVSNVYMGLPVRDIDIFFSFDATEKTINKIKESFNVEPEAEFSYSEGYNSLIEDETPYLIRFNYKGYDIELISSDKSKIFEFDLRFRQFYFIDSKVYATAEAMEDIKKKQIVVVNPNTPLSTLSRIYRFKEELGFEILKESEEYTKWAFKHVHTSFDKTQEYLEKNKHKLSEKVIKKLQDFFEESKEEEKMYHLFGDREKMRYVIEPKNVSFPFHKDLEDVLASKISYYSETIAPNYEKMKTYQPIDKTFSVRFTYNDLENEINKHIKALKKGRIKYLLHAAYEKFPFPKVKKEELKDKYHLYFEGSLLQEMLETNEVIDGPDRGVIHGLAENPLKEEITFTLSGVKNNYGYTLSDIVDNNILLLTSGEGIGYLLRKCDNGKYTISDFENHIPDGSGFYQNALGEKLKKEQGDWFDFNNPNLCGVFGYAHNLIRTEYFFGRVEQEVDFINKKNKDILVPIILNNSSF